MLILFCNVVFAAEESREAMALHHEKMAACLRSNKTLKECQQEMHEVCRKAMSDGVCSMLQAPRREKKLPLKTK